MKSKLSALVIAILTLTGHGVLGAIPAVGQMETGKDSASKSTSQKPKVKLPGQKLWDIQVLQEAYTIVSTKYDPEKRQVTWVLEAKKQVKCLGYHALFLDPDKVQTADLSISLTPSKKEYQKGTRVTAVLRLPSREGFENETNTVTIKASKNTLNNLKAYPAELHCDSGFPSCAFNGFSAGSSGPPFDPVDQVATLWTNKSGFRGG
jgi:hypothetical protein